MLIIQSAENALILICLSAGLILWKTYTQNLWTVAHSHTICSYHAHSDKHLQKVPAALRLTLSNLGTKRISIQNVKCVNLGVKGFVGEPYRPFCTPLFNLIHDWFAKHFSSMLYEMSPHYTLHETVLLKPAHRSCSLLRHKVLLWSDLKQLQFTIVSLPFSSDVQDSKEQTKQK